MGKRPRKRPKHLAAKLFAIREKLGASQTEMTALLNFQVASSRISEFESAKREPNLLVLLCYAKIGARRLTNERVAELAGVGPPTGSRIRNGYTTIGYMTLKKVVEALNLTMAEISTPNTEPEK